MLQQLAGPDGDAAAALAALDESRAAYERLYTEAEAIVHSSMTAARPRPKRPVPPPTTLPEDRAPRAGAALRKRPPPAAARFLGSPAMPRISVVVPIYNVEPYLERCLDSLAGQTLADLEVVMVDDGSTDGSAEIAEAFRARDPRFRLVEQPNRGLGAARNTGIERPAASSSPSSTATTSSRPRLRAAGRRAGRSGSDFATGNVHRLSSTGSRQVGFLANAFAETRLGTHIAATGSSRTTAWPGTSCGGGRSGTRGPALPRGADLRGHAGDAPAALRGAARST